MGRILTSLRGLFSKGKQEAVIDAEAIRNDFKARYHHFKLLLNANNKALEIMAEMEAALRGTKPFGMGFVRSRSTAVSTSVWQIARNLNELAPGKYQDLYDRFKAIQTEINPFLARRDAGREGPLVLSLDAIDKAMADQVGGKMANLGEIRNRVQVRVQNGFAITAGAYYRFMGYSDLQSEIDRRIQATDVDRLDQLHALSAAIRQLIIGAPLPDDLREAITGAYRQLEETEGKQIRVAMRSSALGEDLAGTSFAGQYLSELNVSGDYLLDVYKEIVASKYGLAAMAYRLNRGIRDEDVAMCVGCMSMVDPVSGGVLYSKNPLNMRDDAIVINSVWGLPKSVVDGSSATDLFIVSRSTPMRILRKEVAVKEQKFVCYPDAGVCRLDDTGEEQTLPSLTDEQALELARLAVRLEGHYGVPQDVEWAIQGDGAVVLLQCRPLQPGREWDASCHLKACPQDAAGPILLEGGVAASPGTGAGPVCIVKKDVDMLQFPEGAVLVASQALPRWASLMNRAAAVITETGGVTGHLANVAREFGVPGLFGLEGAAEKMENGQIVTVDAETRRVYEGRIESLLTQAPESGKLMAGSPVYEALQGVARHIVPLNLLDPDSPAFSPKNCMTFHDITRFCHEKAVHEMFRFGKDHRFPERSSKQLFVNVPMQWWVLNLDDGFTEEVTEKYVRLENIASIPMLAIWEGIAAVPWEGPPPVDGKGFASVMFQATTNQAFVPTVRSRFANRNYFMISKNYCSLYSRLGFHFSSVETLVSERSGENYISFQFKGGAADFERRLKRTLFVGDILEGLGFRISIKEDALMARMEDRDLEFMKQRLKAIGYLTIHTRQLDMIMLRTVSVDHYRAKITADLARLTGIQKQ